MTEAAPSIRTLFELRAKFKAEHPQPLDVATWLDLTLAALFPHFDGNASSTEEHLEALTAKAQVHLERSCRPVMKDSTRLERIRHAYLEMLPRLHSILVEDAQAICSGDPAAKSIDEVILSYPGLLAIAVYRIAHELIVLGIPVIPRMMAEIAHSRTGIDIHPGATIGRSFVIDHGTGVVIGETTGIHDNVKLYQGVTLGALSVSKELMDTKRHPTIERDVVIYANATILGGNTVVGAGSTIGGNVWLTKSVPPGSRVYHQP